MGNSIHHSSINQSVNQSTSVDAVPNTRGRQVIYRSACFQVDCSGLGGPGWELQPLESSPSAQLGDALAPCAALQGPKYRYTAHWHDPLARQGSELNRRYLPLRAHRIFQQELSQQTRNFPNFFRSHLPAVTAAIQPEALQLPAQRRRKTGRERDEQRERGQSRRAWEFQRTENNLLLYYQDTISASASSPDQKLLTHLNPVSTAGIHLSHRCCPSPAHCPVASISPSPRPSTLSHPTRPRFSSTPDRYFLPLTPACPPVCSPNRSSASEQSTTTKKLPPSQFTYPLLAIESSFLTSIQP